MHIRQILSSQFAMEHRVCTGEAKEYVKLEKLRSLKQNQVSHMKTISKSFDCISGLDTPHPSQAQRAILMNVKDFSFKDKSSGFLLTQAT